MMTALRPPTDSMAMIGTGIYERYRILTDYMRPSTYDSLSSLRSLEELEYPDGPTNYASGADMFEIYTAYLVHFARAASWLHVGGATCCLGDEELLCAPATEEEEMDI
ncbi:hypothetical protein PtrSN002B_005154 [Pyrenophora tritici-repentis]|nr:hypothetical protein PtrV1_05368 [Pyrenophora tritici-repentis]KAF7450110.1 hypothetical protein A1F99_047260 [Pyrenophora tritici-repentis]KAG9376083.1 hypothetical protein A1F94_013349 [Pyrenophora tritici-repentis]KAI0574175.1 hypothetical protein Alg215_08762 [Pyrenophora tritici-repentis]KAI0592148.1 hypothetical protein Alg130_00600 [Pyrenophora tritici-repentis]